MDSCSHERDLPGGEGGRGKDRKAEAPLGGSDRWLREGWDLRQQGRVTPAVGA